MHKVMICKGTYYEKFLTQVAIAEWAGCLFFTQYHLDAETVTLYPGWSYNALADIKKTKVQKVAQDKYLGVLFS